MLTHLYAPYEEQLKEESRKAVEELQRTTQQRLDAIKEWIEF